ncbi:MAG: hypothetical protein QOD93_6768 [Acetobacteraceae bacterium]|jgi:hypothetical protein|nr:hypothetical protein [Acetobacteraceae bacterium]
MQNLLGYGGTRAIDDGVIQHYVGDARISWADCDDVAEVARICIVNWSEHAGATYRLASDVKTFSEVAAELSAVLGKPFTYEPRPATEFLEKAVAAGADGAYMRSAYENYAAYTAGREPEPGTPISVMQKILQRRMGRVCSASSSRLRLLARYSALLTRLLRYRTPRMSQRIMQATVLIFGTSTEPEFQRSDAAPRTYLGKNQALARIVSIRANHSQKHERLANRAYRTHAPQTKSRRIPPDGDPRAYLQPAHEIQPISADGERSGRRPWKEKGSGWETCWLCYIR